MGVLAFLLYHLMFMLPGGWRGEPWKTIELWLLPWAVRHAYGPPIRAASALYEEMGADG